MKSIKIGDSVIVDPEGRLGCVQGVYKKAKDRQFKVRMGDTGAILLLSSKMCQRAHVAPAQKPQEPKVLYAMRAVANDINIFESDWFDTEDEARRVRNKMARLYHASVDVQVVERTERVCENTKGRFKSHYG